MLAAQTGLRPGVFVWTGGDVHLYENHVEQAREQLGRDPRALPTLMLAERPQPVRLPRGGRGVRGLRPLAGDQGGGGGVRVRERRVTAVRTELSRAVTPTVIASASHWQIGPKTKINASVELCGFCET